MVDVPTLAHPLTQSRVSIRSIDTQVQHVPVTCQESCVPLPSLLPWDSALNMAGSGRMPGPSIFTCFLRQAQHCICWHTQGVAFVGARKALHLSAHARHCICWRTQGIAFVGTRKALHLLAHARHWRTQGIAIVGARKALHLLARTRHCIAAFDQSKDSDEEASKNEPGRQVFNFLKHWSWAWRCPPSTFPSAVHVCWSANS
eukprot:1145843-Pelagomonas_calceolata.AAC.15